MADLNGHALIVREREDGSRILVPADVHAEEWLASMRLNKEGIFEGRQPRHPEFHRFFRAVLAKVAAATGSVYADDDDLLEALCEEVGHGRYITNVRGERRFRRRSTAFSAMDETKYRRFVERCLFVINTRLGINTDTILRETDREQGGVWSKVKERAAKGMKR